MELKGQSSEIVSIILKKYKLNITQARMEVIGLFHSEDRALTSNQIENYLNNSFDRITIYRTIKSFLKSGIIYRILDNSVYPKYAIHSEKSTNINTSHLHFQCICCDKIVCFNDISIPSFNIPEGYSLINVNLLAEGLCTKCNLPK